MKAKLRPDAKLVKVATRLNPSTVYDPTNNKLPQILYSHSYHQLDDLKPWKQCTPFNPCFPLLSKFLDHIPARNQPITNQELDEVKFKRPSVFKLLISAILETDSILTNMKFDPRHPV